MKKLALILVMALACFAQTPAKYSARVKLMVSAGPGEGIRRTDTSVANDDSLKSQFNSFLGRELRSLGDVTLVDDKPDFVMAVLVKRVSEGGSVVSVATLVSASLNASSLTTTLRLRGRLDDSQSQLLTDYMKTGSRILDFSLQNTNLSDVQSICKQIIVDFDSRQLDPERKLWSQGFRPQ